jgi:probable F420-dependent oxidoreductase
VFDESLRVLRSALVDDSATYSGRFFTVSGAAVAPRPVPPLDIWLGGSSSAAFRRIGTLADGWLGSFLTPAEARKGREAIERAAAEAGRQIESDHFGISLALNSSVDGELPAEVAAAVRRRRPDLDPGELVAAGWDQLHRQLDAYLDAGLTKFVIRPVGGAPLDGFIDRFVAELVGRQN